jgi:glyoxylase-like metal-dependent hydrolase (beta-lactamase superfamily II)
MIWTQKIGITMLAACAVSGVLNSGVCQDVKQAFEPVVVETPWGQHVVPQLGTYLDIEVYKHLKPGQPWSAGESLRRQLAEDYDRGRLKLRRFPWRVVEGVFALGHDDHHQLIYLVDTAKGVLLIDPSYDSWQDTVIRQIGKLGYDPSQVRWVLVTHCHVDHAQSCHVWRERGARICVPDGDVHSVESGNQITAWYGVDEPDRHFTGCPVDQRIYDGDQLQFGNLTLYAIATPGHTPGATCYYLFRDGRRILFSGDIALHNGQHAWMGNPYADWDQYLKSLEKLTRYALHGSEIRYDVLLPGHATVDLDQGMRSVWETVKIVRNIVARRQSGESIDWIDPYPWNWKQGVVYGRKEGGQASTSRAH